MKRKKIIIFKAILIAFLVAQCSQGTGNNSEIKELEETFSPNTTLFNEIEPLTLQENIVENRYYGKLVKFEYKKDLFNKVIITDPKKTISIKAICSIDCEKDSLVLTNENFLNVKIDGVDPLARLNFGYFQNQNYLVNIKQILMER